MPFVRSAAQTFNKAAALWRRHGALPLAIGLGIPDVYYSDDKTAALSANIASVAATYAVRKSPSFLTGILAPVAAYGTVRGAFYYNKQKHNTLEGFQENGIAGKSRKSYGFGSGWMGGTPTSLMGQAIDPEISAYREDIMDVRSERRALYARIHQAEEASLAQMGSLSGPDYMAANIERIKGINAAREGLQAVNLSRFNVEIEDADTLVLKRGGLSGLFDNEIQIRLAGIDAPETAGHAGDPLEEVRFWQAQPGGEEAAERLRQIMGTGEGFQAVVGPDKTYGRYLGALIGPGGENINIQLAREGMVAALPFGEAEEEVVQRGPVGRAQAQAQAEGAGIWGMARYQAIAQAQEAIGQPITYNTMTRLDKLSQNLNLGAYASFLQDMGTERRALTPEEQDLSRRMGYSLKKSHGPQRFNKAKNPIKGHDSGHWGRNWVTDAIDSDFEPGASWVRAAVKAGAPLESIVEAGTRMGAGIVEGQLKTVVAASGRDVATIAQSLKGKSADDILAAIQSEFRVSTKGGEGFIRGRALGEGSFKQAELAYRPADPSATKYVYASEKVGAKQWQKGYITGFTAEARKRALKLIKKGKDLSGSMIDPKFLNPAAIKQAASVTAQVERAGGSVFEQEVRAQTAAVKQFGSDVVPGVVGRTESGFIQEYAGKEIGMPHEIQKRIQRVFEGGGPRYTSLKQAGDPERFDLAMKRFATSTTEKAMSRTQGILHVDLHHGNISRQGSRLRAIDWGQAYIGKFSPEFKKAISGAQQFSIETRGAMRMRPYQRMKFQEAKTVVAPSPIPKKGPPPIPRTTPPPIPKKRIIQHRRLQSEASGIGLKMNAARRGSKKM